MKWPKLSKGAELLLLFYLGMSVPFIMGAMVRGAAGGGAVTGWPTDSSSKELTWANSLLNAARFGDGVLCTAIYTHPTHGQVIGPCVDANVSQRIPDGFIGGFWSWNTADYVFKVDPEGANPNLQYVFVEGHQPLLDSPVILRPSDGCTVAEEAILTDDPLAEWITCTDTTDDAVAFDYVIPTKLSGDTTAKLTLLAVNKNASPSGTFTLQCAGRLTRPGLDAYAAHDTTGQQDVSFTTFDTQNRPETATATFTYNGTIAAGAHLKGQCNVSATPAQIADIRLSGTGIIQLSANSLSNS